MAAFDVICRGLLASVHTSDEFVSRLDMRGHGKDFKEHKYNANRIIRVRKVRFPACKLSYAVRYRDSLKVGP